MLLACLDEIGEPGGFISHEHPRFNTSPAFGYAGFIILVEAEGSELATPEDWQKRLRKLEVKGSGYFRANTH